MIMKIDIMKLENLETASSTSESDTSTEVSVSSSTSSVAAPATVKISEADLLNNRHRRQRRRISEIGDDDLWFCAFAGCTKRYKKTSTQSINQHKEQCQQRMKAVQDQLTLVATNQQLRQQLQLQMANQINQEHYFNEKPNFTVTPRIPQTTLNQTSVPVPQINFQQSPMPFSPAVAQSQINFLSSQVMQGILNSTATLAQSHTTVPSQISLPKPSAPLPIEKPISSANIIRPQPQNRNPLASQSSIPINYPVQYNSSTGSPYMSTYILPTPLPTVSSTQSLNLLNPSGPQIPLTTQTVFIDSRLPVGTPYFYLPRQVSTGTNQ